MRDVGDDSSAGSTPPPPLHLDSFSPSGFFVDYEPPPSPPPAAEELWTHLELDGWCFNSDNHHHQQQQKPQQQALRAASSEPVRQKNACGSRRPPRPCRGSSSVRETKTNKRKQYNPMVNNHPFDRHHFQECDDSVVQSLASENVDKDEVSSSESDESEIQSDLPANEKRPPEIGMEFFSEEEAYKFYKKYADELGFSVRKGKVQRLTTGAIRKRNFLCSRQGFKMSNNNNQTTKYKRKETRTGCYASIQFTVEDGNKWVVSNFVSDHNHELQKKPKKRHHRDVVQAVNSLHLDLDHHPHRLPNVQPLMDCFLSLQAKDPSFFYAIQLDAANRATNFFWRDGGSRADYGCFADVVVFDTTRRIGAVCAASFWGLNHHRRRISFAHALLLDETLESFVWLFRAFAAAMDEPPPGTLYSTEESRVIASAAETVFPKTKHRLSAINICNNAKTSLSGYLFEQCGFEDDFKKCLLGCRPKEEFDSEWDSLLARYDLRENPWLVNVHSLWENWSPLSGKNIFSAGIEEFFDDCTSTTSTEFQTLCLPDFVRRSAKEAKRSRLLELQEDLEYCGKKASERPRKGMVKEAEDSYTGAMFKIFEDELLDSLSLEIVEETPTSVQLREAGQDQEKEETVSVAFDASNSSVVVACSCGKFETIGILCGHCLKVLNARKTFQIPPRYVAKRWTKSAKRKEVSGSCYPRNVVDKALEIVAKSMGIEESRTMVEGYLDMALRKAEEILIEKGSKIVKLYEDEDEDEAEDERGSKSTPSRSTRKRQGWENYNIREIWLDSKVFGNEDSGLNRASQAESQSTAKMPRFDFNTWGL